MLRPGIPRSPGQLGGHEVLALPLIEGLRHAANPMGVGGRLVGPCAKRRTGECFLCAKRHQARE